MFPGGPDRAARRRTSGLTPVEAAVAGTRATGVASPESVGWAGPLPERTDELVARFPDGGAEAVNDAADAARKTASQASIYMAFSLLVGAFIASISAALGGKLRDEHP